LGTVKLNIDGHILSVEGVCYIPDLSGSIYSLFLHVKCPGHGIHSSFEDGQHISFPTFTTKTVLGDNDIHINAILGNDTIKSGFFLAKSDEKAPSTSIDPPYVWNLKIDDDQGVTENTPGDNILTTL
jgi:hypothetical protein